MQGLIGAQKGYLTSLEGGEEPGGGDGARKDLEAGMGYSGPGAACVGLEVRGACTCGDLGVWSSWAVLGEQKAGPREPGQVVVWTLSRGVDS